MTIAENEPMQNGNKDLLAGEANGNQTWKNNHRLITKVMAKLIRHYERWPTKAEVIEASGLSKATVYKHYKQLMQEDMMAEELAQFKFISSGVSANLYVSAVGGDIKAMRLSFEVAGILKRR